jgi:hypothetical protein
VLGFNTISGAPLSTLLATQGNVIVNLVGVEVLLALGLQDVTAAADIPTVGMVVTTVVDTVNITGSANIPVVTNTPVDPAQITLGIGNTTVVDLSWTPVNDSQTATWVDVIPRN